MIFPFNWSGNMKKLLNLLNKFIEDLFVFAGLTVLVFTTYSINTSAGNYFLGLVLLVFGFLLSRGR